MPSAKKERRGNFIGSPEQQIEIFIDMLRQKMKNKAPRTRALYIPLMRSYLNHLLRKDPHFLVLSCYATEGKSVWRGIEDFPESLSNAQSKVQFLSAYILVRSIKLYKCISIYFGVAKKVKILT